MSDLTPFDTSPSTPADPTPQLFGPPQQARFLDSLAETGNVRAASAAAGISPQTAYRARRAKPAFARLWDAALLHARAAVEQVLADRALNGVDEPIFYRGEEIGHRRRYDSRLLLAHLARLDRLAERAEARAEVRDFDGALAVMEGGEEWEPAELDNAADPDDDVPELEAAMRLLEAQGWAEVDGEWVFQGEEEAGDADEADDPSVTALARRATSPFALRENGEDQGSSPFLPEAQMGRWRAPQARDGGVEEGDAGLLPPDPHDFRKWEQDGTSPKARGGAKHDRRAGPSTTFGGPPPRSGEDLE